MLCYYRSFSAYAYRNDMKNTIVRDFKRSISSVFVDCIDHNNIHENILKIHKYPHPALRQENTPISTFDKDLHKIVREMFKLMYSINGSAAMAAPQVGINKQLIVFNEDLKSLRRPQDEVVYINPKIIYRSKAMVTYSEVCDSIPNVTVRVPRHRWIDIQYQDITGAVVSKRLKSSDSVYFQHEYDHLQQILLVDHMKRFEIRKYQPVLDKLISDFGLDKAAI